MLGKNLFIFISFIVIFISAFVGQVNASTIPSFPVCANPQGEIKSSYASGTHGVPGDTKTYTGSDTVYKVSEETATQCLCTTEGNGIQTNWWKVSELSEDEIDILKNQGWILIPDGSAWGNDQGAYLAKNSNYSCSGGTGGVGGSSENKSENNSGGSSSQSISSGIFSLANTGNMIFILTVFTFGMLLLGTGLIFSFKNKR